MTPDRRQELAAEFSLGVLEGKDLVCARDMLRDDPQFAAEVAAWSGRLAPLLDGIEPVSPPEHVFSAIQQRLGRGVANDNTPDLRRSRNLWRGAALGAGTIAASLALVVLVPQILIEPEPVDVVEPRAPMVAVMEAEGSDARLVATWDEGDQSLVVAAAAGIAPVAGRSHELWVIPADGVPRSMGLLPGPEPMHLRVAAPMARQLAEGATLALSVEPTGGSPTGLPTGQVIAAGKLART